MWPQKLFMLTLVLQQPLYFATTTINGLLHQAESLLIEKKDPTAAFGVLSKVYAQDPNAAGLTALIESCLRLKIETSGDFHDRYGLSALLVDQERYEEACVELQKIISSSAIDSSPALMERTSALLYRSKAAICDWDTREDDDKLLLSLLKLDERTASKDFMDVPTVHPFDALKWPCISLAKATQISQIYARRAILSQGLDYTHATTGGVVQPRSTVTISSDPPRPNRPLRLAYLSPDFTAKHPLAFLMQHVFQHHDRRAFQVHVFSLCQPQDCPEVQAIRDGSDAFTVLSTERPSVELAQQIRDAGVDILIDLCGYTGTSRVAEILTHRPAPLQISYMGFPASTGAPYLDYMIVDSTVVPESLRHGYTEGLLVLPHSYFVNSHATCVSSPLEGSKVVTRSMYDLPADAMIFSCHSRPDKLDPSMFDLWVNTIAELRERHGIPAVLWLLKSCPTMEANLRRRAQRQSLPDEALHFCDIAPRSEHLQRLALADVFLDTPAYNAHTVGCDTLYAQTPMISLLSSDDDHSSVVETTKMASRVGASLLWAVGLEELAATSRPNYKALMMRCALDRPWFSQITAKLQVSNKASLPLFNTKMWVQHLDRALLYLATNVTTGADVHVLPM